MTDPLILPREEYDLVKDVAAKLGIRIRHAPVFGDADLIVAVLVARLGSAVEVTDKELRCADPSRLSRTDGEDGIRLWIASAAPGEGQQQ